MSARGLRHCRTAQRGIASLDRQFDRLVPDELQHLSSTHWTPVQVAVRAATLLCPTPRTRVLDVGSGIGKLCTIGALSTFGTWVGAEQHEPLVKTATELARRLGVSERTQFLQIDAFDLDWSDFDALYFYNPFELALFGEHATSPSPAVQIARVQRRLAAVRDFTRVVTFHGFGGVMPSTFELIYHERVAGFGLDLALWMQRSHRTVSSVLS
jgi:hypothetical protein